MLKRPCAPSVTRRSAPRATSPVSLRCSVEEKETRPSLLHRPEEDGGGGRPRNGLTEGARNRRRYAPLIASEICFASRSGGPSGTTPWKAPFGSIR